MLANIHLRLPQAKCHRENDERKKKVTKKYIYFIIVRSKVKRNGTPIENFSVIHIHSENKICPDETYKAYKKRIAETRCIKPHHLPQGNTISYLIRGFKDHSNIIEAQLISKQNNKLMSLLPLPPNFKIPKTRSLGFTRITSSGAK
ncbi:hypothetical protein AYI70_g5559 [Smittium culicis]|uniref:Uncharacterized protein n=1 Tax=Smittium culicis TaxID=133412 RepID=A0A1R1XU06_9FUNG|nr:hypothetical protein AYI70_g5559 [Smittium culicis]